MAQVQFGLAGLAAQARQPRAAGAAAAIRVAVESAVCAEEVGFDSVWTGEHHGAHDGFMPAPLVLLAAIAARTTRVHLGTNVIIGPLWDPVRLAEEAAVVDLLSEGRLILGLGIGYLQDEYIALDRDFARRAVDLDQLLEFLPRAYRGESLVSTSRPSAPVCVTPQPSWPDSPRVVVGGFVRASVDRACRASAGYLAPTLGVEALRERIDWVLAADPPAGFLVGVGALGEAVAASSSAPTRPETFGRVAAPRPTDAGVAVRATGPLETWADQLAPLVDELARLPESYVGTLTLSLVRGELTDEEILTVVRRVGLEVLPELRQRVSGVGVPSDRRQPTE